MGSSDLGEGREGGGFDAIEGGNAGEAYRDPIRKWRIGSRSDSCR